MKKVIQKWFSKSNNELKWFTLVKQRLVFNGTREMSLNDQVKFKHNLLSPNVNGMHNAKVWKPLGADQFQDC